MPALIAGAPPLTVELYLGGSAFTLDDPELSVLDAGNVCGPTADGWHDLTASTLQASWRIGATVQAGPVSRMAPGFATIDVYDPDRVYDAGNPTGPFRGRLAPPAGLRVTAWEAAPTSPVAVPQFTGKLHSAGWEAGESRFTATDGTADLAAYDPPEGPAVGAGESSGARVARILTEADYRGPASIAVGTVTVQATALAQTALTELYRVTDSELGALYVDRSGVLQYLDRTAWTVRRPALDTIGGADLAGVLTATRSELTADAVRNIVYAAGAELDQVEAEDPESRARWGPRRWGRNDLLLRTGAELQAWCDELIVWTGDVRAGAVSELVLWPPGAPRLWPLVCRLDPLLPIGLELSAGGYEAPILVGWSHSVTARDWRTTLVLSPHPLDAVEGAPFTLDDPARSMLDAGNVVT